MGMTAPARILADSVNARLRIQFLMEAQPQIASAARTADMFTFEDIVDASADDGKALFARISPGRTRALRTLIAAERRGTQMPRPAKPQFPEARFGRTVRKHPIQNTIGARAMPTQQAVNFTTKLKRGAAAIDPPYMPRPSPKL